MSDHKKGVGKKAGGGGKKKKSSSTDDNFTDSLGKIVITPPGEKPPKALKMIADEIHDQYTLSVRWPLMVYEAEAVFTLPKFKMCETWWSLSLSRLSFGDGDGFLSVTLTSLADQTVRAGYSFTIKNQLDGDDYEWEDPEGVLTFSRKSEGNNEWGTSELISVEELENTDGYVVKEKLIIQVDVFVHDRHDLNAHDNLAEQIEHLSDKKDLIALANEDLVEVISKLPVRRNIKAQKQQEDTIVRVRAK